MHDLGWSVTPNHLNQFSSFRPTLPLNILYTFVIQTSVLQPSPSSTSVIWTSQQLVPISSAELNSKSFSLGNFFHPVLNYEYSQTTPIIFLDWYVKWHKTSHLCHEFSSRMWVTLGRATKINIYRLLFNAAKSPKLQHLKRVYGAGFEVLTEVRI